jgi:hypothetical protein
MFLVKMISQFGTDSIIEIILQAFLIFLSIYKFFYFIRIYDDYCGLLILIEKCAKEAIPLVVTIIFLIFGFSKLYMTLHMGINDPENEYAGIKSVLIKMIFQTYKSISDK